MKSFFASVWDKAKLAVVALGTAVETYPKTSAVVAFIIGGVIF